jgi:hypothetical protein
LSTHPIIFSGSLFFKATTPLFTSSFLRIAYQLVTMDTDDMPDFMAAPEPVGGGTADEMLDEADELENLLEDALEEAAEEEEEDAGNGAAPMEIPNAAAHASAAQPTPIPALGKFIEYSM